MYQDVDDHNSSKNLLLLNLLISLDRGVVIVSNDSSNFCLSSDEIIFCCTSEFKNSTAIKPTRAKPAKGRVP